MSTQRTRVAVLGSTGSIGVSTLDVVARHPDRYSVVALTAHSNSVRLREQCIRHRPELAVLASAAAAAKLEQELREAGVATRVLSGEDALCEVASHERIDVVMAGIVGAAGLKSSLAAARAGKKILLANKEALVMSGPLFMEAVRQGGATLVPVDSEHNAIFQCLPSDTRAGVRSAGVNRVVLTASGGPFLRTARDALRGVTPDQACAHPRWVMGRKISVDSATLMNKGLELIEACLLFNLPPAQVEVVVHPQSIVHSLVEYCDGSMLAQLGNPDMRVPIAHALGWPQRIASGVESLDIVRAGRLDFEAPDLEKFPCLVLARRAAEAGGTAPAVLNAANEVAVSAFLSGQLAFVEIPAIIDQILSQHDVRSVTSLQDVMAADGWARSQAQARLGLAGPAAGVCA
ncbi:MAG TPA: 1-deoxy-D-xylulose-5-phosphate reductoisomerase [Povalibacter sp.]|uniref:1-deoxy-D-xylulose-5-phosphate reductoisomerase n=1 Tax=Povalibacter sp. TaxID=1962978 RepID=UPI002CC46052|nr:1-deoxy-D-xylulose-5-phosphate reductoisomerase [Povalibacter sp.]HMN46229.1 1-deoxy-D-xylulose-5-phosphate reductoisomerase [Povalibacter sp.]